MQKLTTLFEREDEKPFRVMPVVAVGCGWVRDGEGVATRKWDGSACRVLDGKLYRRHRVKKGKAVPEGWVHWDDDPAVVSGHGWAPVSDHSSDQYHREAWAALRRHVLINGTYELCGPKLQKNVEGFSGHVLVPHGEAVYPDCPRTFDALRSWLTGSDIEGIVWHHPDGRMAKIKQRDFGLVRSWRHVAHLVPDLRVL